MKMPIAEFFSIAVAAIFVQNLVMVYMLASNVFFRVLKNPSFRMMFGILVTITTTLSSALAWTLNRFVLKEYGLTYLSPFAFLFVIILLEFAAEMLLRRFAPGLRKELAGLLPASAFNCAVLGLVFINVQLNTRGILGTTFYGLCAGIGFLLVLFIAGNAMERVRSSTPPVAFRGLPIAFVTAGILSLAFMGFSGIRIPF